MKDKLNEILRNVMKLLAARDKVLWEGEAGKGNTLTVPGLSDYRMAEAWTRYGHFYFDPQRGYVNGIHGDQNADTDQSITHQIHGVVNGNTLRITLCHYYATGSSAVTQTTIRKIIGVEPIRSRILSGGGWLLKGILAACRALLGGVRHEIDVKRHLEKTDEKERRHGLGQLAFVHPRHELAGVRSRHRQKNWQSGGAIRKQHQKQGHGAAEGIKACERPPGEFSAKSESHGTDHGDPPHRATKREACCG